MLKCANPLPLGRGELEQWGEISENYIPPSWLKIIQLNFPEPLNRGRWKQAAVGLGSLLPQRADALTAGHQLCQLGLCLRLCGHGFTQPMWPAGTQLPLCGRTCSPSGLPGVRTETHSSTLYIPEGKSGMRLAAKAV